MKQLKSQFALLIAGLLIMSSCTKTTQSETEPQINNSDEKVAFQRKTTITRAYLLTLSPSVRKATYNTCTPTEKYNIWLDKKNQVLGLTVWNSAQLSDLNSIFNQLSINLFTDGSAEDISFKNTFEPTWVASAIPNFNENTIKRIVNTLDDIDPNYLNDDIFEEDDNNNCKCSSGSDWCIPFLGDCEKRNSCKKKKSGCGTFWRWACDGLCPIALNIP